jgi:hypothetical protein
MRHRELLHQLRRAEQRAGAMPFMNTRKAWLDTGRPPLGKAASQLLDHEQLLAELAGAQVSHDIEEHWPQDRERVAAVRLRLAAVAAARHGDASAWETLHRLAVDREANRSF